MDMALNAAVQAQSSTDPNLQREYWKETLAWLDNAEIYGESDDSTALRAHVRNTLDKLDGITRVMAMPALKEDLSGSAVITQMAASGTEVYALDGSKGEVWRLFLTSSGYQIDMDFQCSPDPAMGIDPLVDLVSLPPVNPLGATIMALDKNGKLVYCAPGNRFPWSN